MRCSLWKRSNANNAVSGPSWSYCDRTLKNPSSLSQRDLVQFVLAATGGLTARGRPEPTMKLPHSVCEVLRDHVVLESKCIRASAVSSV